MLDYLRKHQGKAGTKEGCAEGDCGACTIVLAREDESGNAIYEAVNSCLLMLPQLDGANVVTVEGIADADTLDPVQAAMVETDGTQCGFCTPGFIMALYALRQGGEKPTDEVIHEALAGNLCRCTGYTPIVAAAKKACGNAPPDVVGAHATLVPSSSYATENQRFCAPTSLEDLAALRAAHPSAHLLAGGTDLGILTSKERQPLPEIISTVHVEELLEITETDDYLELGAAVTYTRALPYIKRLYPSFATLITRIGSRQIRNMGTFGGNIGVSHWRYLTVSYCPRCHGNSPFSVWGAVCAAGRFFHRVQRPVLDPANSLKPSTFPSSQVARRFGLIRFPNATIRIFPLSLERTGLAYWIIRWQAFEWPSAAWRRRQKSIRIGGCPRWERLDGRDCTGGCSSCRRGFYTPFRSPSEPGLQTSRSRKPVCSPLP